MSYEFSLVPFGQISYVVPALLANLEKSQFWTKGRANVDDIVRFILTGQMNLWVLFDTESSMVEGHVITEIKEYPQCKMLVVQYCAAEPHLLDQVGDKVFGILEQFGEACGCKGIEFFGRPGWGPHVKQRGYVTRTVVYEKHFKESL
jgi:hypothetical protein